jgi:hypothetical protein
LMCTFHYQYNALINYNNLLKNEEAGQKQKWVFEIKIILSFP